MYDLRRPTRGVPDQMFIRDVVTLSQHHVGDGWYHLQLDEGDDSPIGLQIKIERDGDLWQIVGYTTYNR